MFGYVKAYRPWLRVSELDLYKGVYCGLCKTITERSGFVPSLLLSYDLVFLTVAALGYDKSAVAAEKRRCPLHPIKKTPCVYWITISCATICMTRALKSALPPRLCCRFLLSLTSRRRRVSRISPSR